MSDEHRLKAFGWLLLAILALYGIAAYLATQGKYAETIGIGGAGTALVGILGTLVGGRQQTPVTVETAHPGTRVTTGTPAPPQPPLAAEEAPPPTAPPPPPPRAEPQFFGDQRQIDLRERMAAPPPSTETPVLE